MSLGRIITRNIIAFAGRPCLFQALGRDPAQHNQDQRAYHKGAAPNPILNNPGMRFTLGEVQPVLAQRSQICIKEEARYSPDGYPKHVGAEWYACKAIKVGNQTRWKQGMKLTQDNDFPAFTFNGRFQGA